MTYGQKPRPLGITALAIPDAAGAAVSLLLGFSLLSGMQAYIQSSHIMRLPALRSLTV